MIELPHAMTGRPTFVDPHAVSAVTDALEMRPSAIAGGQPTPTIVGALVIVAGAQIPIAGDASDVAEVINAARAPLSRISN